MLTKTIFSKITMEQGLLRLCTLRKPFRLVQIDVKLIQKKRYSNSASKFRKYRPFTQKEDGCYRGIYTQVSQPLRKEAAKATEKETQKAAQQSIPGVEYSKLTIGVPKELWKDERRSVKNVFAEYFRYEKFIF